MTYSGGQIAVIGGGHAGLLTAAALEARGLDCCIVEPRPLDPDGDAGGRGLALMAGSREIMDRLGIWRFVAAECEPVRAVKVQDQSGDGWVDYRPEDMGGRVFGYGIDSERLRALLVRAVLSSGRVEVRSSGLSGLVRSKTKTVLELEDGSAIDASLVIGADGRGSTLRQLAGIAVSTTAYDQAAATFTVRHERSSDATVREYLGACGPLALLPLGDQTTGVTWVEKPDEARRLTALSPDAMITELTNAIGQPFGAMHLVSPVQCYPLHAQHAARYVAPRLALVGDAAHGVHPIHAQGLNMGIADIGKLVELITKASERRLDIGGSDILLAYERARWWDNQTRLWLTDGLNRIFSNDLSPLVSARGGALSLLRKSQFVRRQIMRRGMQLA